MSVSAAELPEMSRSVGTHEQIADRLRSRLGIGLRRIAFFVVPSVAAFFAIGDDLVAALYQRGRFTTESTLYVWYILMGYAVGLLAATLSRLYSSVLYAMNDTRTPLRIATVRVALAAALGWLLAFPLRPLLVDLVTGPLDLPLPALLDSNFLPVDPQVALGAVGLSFASGVIAWIEFGLLRAAVRRRIGRPAGDVMFQIKLWAAAIAGGLAGFTVSKLLLPVSIPGLPPIPHALAAAGTFGIIYLICAIVFRIPEVGAITRRFRLS
jgi:putative peptidoglycan lipid II flippase